MMELLLKSVLVYHSPMFEAWKVPKRPVEVSCDVTHHLVAYTGLPVCHAVLRPRCRNLDE